jgi:hypothetical protein
VRKNRNRIEPAFAAAVARDEQDMRGFDRKDSVAMLCAILAAGAIMTNALFLQRGPHPAPILTNRPAAPASKAPLAPAAPVAAAVPAPAESKEPVLLPRSRPVEIQQPAKLDAVKTEPVKSEPLPKSDAMSPPRPVRNIPMPEANVSRPPDPIGEIIAPPTRRVSAVQRVLSEYGYGQIKPTGTLDRETQDAIEQFQRSKKLTVTRQITPELMRELAVLTGRPIE